MNRVLKGLSYTFYRNIGKEDRIIRILTAVILFVAMNLFELPIVVNVIFGILALMILATAVLGKCGLFYMCNYRTISKQERQHLKEENIKYEE